MNADYLWDRSGPVDEQIADLERVLGPLRFTGVVPDIRPARPPVRRAWLALAAVAAAILLSAAVWYALTPASVPRAPQSWRLAASGSYDAEPPARSTSVDGTTTGQWIETPAGTSVTLTGVRGAIVIVEGASRVRVVDLGDTAQRLELARGSVYTQPAPSTLPVEIATPVGVASVRPGTACVVALAADGRGGVEVKRGLVEFADPQGATHVPDGARVPISPAGLGTPRASQASPSLVAALDAFDESRWVHGAAAAGVALGSVLQAAGATDELTLWNLMYRADESGRKRIIGRARELTKSMWKIDSEALLRLDEGAMDAWWELLQRR